MSWRPHIEKITLKLYRGIASIRTLQQRSIPSSSLIQIYHALFFSHIVYCLPVWGGCGAGDIKILQTLQNRAIRAVFGLNFGESVRKLIIQHDLLDIKSLISFHTQMFAYKNFNGLLPYESSFHYVKDTKSNLRGFCGIKTAGSRTSLQKNSIYVRVAKIWNDLRPNIRNTTSLSGFKRTLKEDILKDQKERLIL
jgi:hypothetical protein